MGLGDPLTNRALRRREVASDFEVLDSLLSTLTDVLDVRQVFDRVSKVVQPILPHDIMGVVEVNEAGNRFKLLAGAGSPSGSSPFEGAIADPELLKRWDAQGRYIATDCAARTRSARQCISHQAPRVGL